MTNCKFSRKRIVQALGLLVLGLVLWVGNGGYGQYQGPNPGCDDPFFLARTDGNGAFRVAVPNQPNTFVEINRTNKRKLNGEHAVVANEDVLIGIRFSDDGNIMEYILFAIGCPAPTAQSAGHARVASLQQQTPIFFFIGLVGEGPNRFRVQTSGGVTTIKSHLLDNSLWAIEVVFRELKLKVGETFRLTGLAEKTAERDKEKLRNPVVVKNTKAEVAEAKVIKPEGSELGEIEFTAKAVGETNIMIEYDFYSHIVTSTFLGRARFVVTVKVEQ